MPNMAHNDHNAARLMNEARYHGVYASSETRMNQFHKCLTVAGVLLSMAAIVVISVDMSHKHAVTGTGVVALLGSVLGALVGADIFYMLNRISMRALQESFEQFIEAQTDFVRQQRQFLEQQRQFIQEQRLFIQEQQQRDKQRDERDKQREERDKQRDERDKQRDERDAQRYIWQNDVLKELKRIADHLS
jgi:membrane protein involved in colicin uptake